MSNEYAEMSMGQINMAVEARLSGDALNYWAQQPRTEICNLCVQVQRGEMTIDEAAAKVEEYANWTPDDAN